MSIAIMASGTLLKVQSDVSNTLYNTVPESMKIKCPDCKFELLDVTSHDSTGFFKQWLPGLSDGENVTDEFNYVPTNAIHTQLRVDAYNRQLDNWELIFAGAGSGANIAFTAYVVSMPATADIGQVLRATMTAKITGEPTWT